MECIKTKKHSNDNLPVSKMKLSDLKPIDFGPGSEKGSVEVDKIVYSNKNNIKLLILSDIHDEEIVLEKAKTICEKEKPDYIFIAGDTTNCSVSFVEDTLDMFKTFAPTFIVPGNNEPENVLKFLESRKEYIHEKRIELADSLNIVGFGFSNITPYGTPGELSEEEIYERMSRLDIDQNTLLLCHCPPYGIFDQGAGSSREKHIGSVAIRKIIEEKKPFLMFCGHAHEWFGTKKLGETTIVKVLAAKLGGAVILTITNKRINAEFIRI
ncbi:MAG: metallophosphoesterase [Candidatus Micrarchaeota archaeon]